MENFRDDYLISRQEYGILFPYIADDDVSEIFWNSNDLWIDDRKKGRYMAPEKLSEAQATHLSMLIEGSAGKQPDQDAPVISWDGDKMNIRVLDQYISGGGIVFRIKKDETRSDFTAKSLVETGFCKEEEIKLLKEIINDKKNLLICGEGDTKKKELLRFLTRYIPASDRVISVGDEWSSSVFPPGTDKNVTELKIDQEDTRNMLYGLCMGLEPDRLTGCVTSLITAAEILRISDTTKLCCHLILCGTDMNDGLQRLKPTVDERVYKWIMRGWSKLFPIRIELGSTGIKKIIIKDGVYDEAG